MSDWRKVKNVFLDGLLQAVEASGGKYEEHRRLEVIQATWDRNGSLPVLAMVAVGRVGWWACIRRPTTEWSAPLRRSRVGRTRSCSSSARGADMC